MTPRSLHTVLRHLADAGPPTPDADLLARFAADRDDAAFAELVRRHGRLVWGVCRHLTRSDADADDAFQATFLVLLRNAPRVRDAGKLPAWLHGVAYRVCTKARLATKRRGEREQVAANGEGQQAVPEAAWDRALATVHEEVAKLPETLRVPFVLCCLEGQGVTAAAEQLGWKLGTLSGRLTRAKDALLARLDARGLTAGAAATTAIAVGVANAPAGVVAKAVALVRSGVTVPASVLQLSHGVIGMSVSRVKLLAAGVLLACGLGLGAWSGLTANADAQAPKVEKEKPKADAPPRKEPGTTAALFDKYIDSAKADAAKGPKWVYHYEPQLVGEGSGLKPSELEAKLAGYEVDGWQFVGQVMMRVESTLGGEVKGKGGLTLPTLVFRKPAGGEVDHERTIRELQRAIEAMKEGGGLDKASAQAKLAKLLMQDQEDMRKSAEDTAQKERAVERALLFLKQQEKDGPPVKYDAKAPSPEVEALKEQIAVLEAKLAKLSGKGGPVPPARADVGLPMSVEVRIRKDALLDAADLVETLRKMAAKRFGKEMGGLKLSAGHDEDGANLVLTAPKPVVEWAVSAFQRLTGEK